MKISEPPWATPWHIGRVSYIELEAKLAKTAEREMSPSSKAGAPSISEPSDRNPTDVP